MPSIALPVSLRGQLLSGSKFSPYSLFTFGTQGIWLDPSDVANLTWRRNLLTYSEQFDNAAWVKVGVTVPSTTSTAPDGTATADKAVATNTASGTRALYQNFTAPSTTTYTLTVYAKAAEYSLLALQEISGGRFGASFDLTANSSTSLGGAGYVTSSITPVGNSWFRCAVVWTGVAAAGYAITTVGYPSGTTPSAAGTSYAGDGTSGILIWGAQLELGTSATDYQRISDVNTEVIERFPTATMYQDAAGTTPVTTPGQPVGLRLDKSKGLVLGAELVEPIDFTTGWTFSGSAVTFDDANTYTAAGVANVFRAYFTVGKWYKMEISVTTTGGAILLFNGNAAVNPIGPASLVNGEASTFYFYAAATQLNIRTPNAATVNVDNISVRELAGNHATQSVLASRPVYGIEPAGGRRNLLTWSEDFRDTTTAGSTRPWTYVGATVAADSTTAPNGATTADLLTENTAGGAHDVEATPAATATTAYTVSAYFKRAAGVRDAYIQVNDNASGTNGAVAAVFDLSSGASSVSVLVAGFTSVTANAVAVGSGWYRCSLSLTTVAGTTTLRIFQGVYNASRVYTGDGTSGIYVWGAQLELGSTVTPYQRVTTAFDVTEAGVQSCHYVQYDGINHGMITNSIDFTATDKMSVFAGVRKLSDAARGVLVELSPNTGLNSGSFVFDAPGTIPAAEPYRFISSGTVFATAATSGPYAAPIANVLTGLGDIPGDLATLRVNGAQAAQATTDQGTGNFGNYPLYLGRRFNNPPTVPSGLPFNGRDYGIVVVGKATTADEITSTERWLSGKTGFYAPIITGVPTIGVS